VPGTTLDQDRAFAYTLRDTAQHLVIAIENHEEVGRMRLAVIADLLALSAAYVEERTP
jgi:hypothetical protein